MVLKAKPIYIIKPDEQFHCGAGPTPYYYLEELKEMGLK